MEECGLDVPTVYDLSRYCCGFSLKFEYDLYGVCIICSRQEVVKLDNHDGSIP